MGGKGSHERHYASLKLLPKGICDYEPLFVCESKKRPSRLERVVGNGIGGCTSKKKKHWKVGISVGSEGRWFWHGGDVQRGRCLRLELVIEKKNGGY